ncbi:predicted protein [Nematostella vectensis]|uniref:ABC transmembrane type-1 domain-containing protein n=1 Tax=Nematostella vectensis TaxID=45351 RepID=A7SY39_NEMVE|nr:predicted protein [Nematostella vectensis]|eukprot:XP_001623465.1 predicted protein [Nematostella vectensis]
MHFKDHHRYPVCISTTPAKPSFTTPCAPSGCTTSPLCTRITSTCSTPPRLTLPSLCALRWTATIPYLSHIMILTSSTTTHSTSGLNKGIFDIPHLAVLESSRYSEHQYWEHNKPGLQRLLAPGACCPHTGIVALFEISVALVLLVVLIGWQALSGVLFYFIVAVYISAMAGQLSKLKRKSCALADEPLGIMGEIIAGIRTVKMLALEWFYRDKERDALHSYKESGTVEFFRSVLHLHINRHFISSLLYADVSLFVFKIFTLVMTLNIMRFSVTVCLTECLRGLADAKVALQRIERFLVTTNNKPIGNPDTEV